MPAKESGLVSNDGSHNQGSPWPPARRFFLRRASPVMQLEETMFEGLYLVTPQGTEQQILEITRAALLGGAKIVQYRDKQRPRDGQIALARRLVQLCKEKDAIFLVNDSPEIAEAGLADGVHLGQGDLSI